MLQLTLFEKLKILFDLILASPFFIFLFIFAILVFLILQDTKYYDKKLVKEYIIGIYVLVFIAAIIKYHSSFLSLLDYLIDNIAVVFYFPNLAIYMAMILISNIIMLRTIFKDSDKVSRTLNIAMYSTIMYLMLLTISIISTETLNVYDQVSLYQNSNVLALVELSNTIFIIWMLLAIINKLLDVLEVKGLKIKSKLFPERPRIITKYVPKEVIKNVPVEVIKEVPVEKIIYKEKEETFTKEEYKIMLHILKSINK